MLGGGPAGGRESQQPSEEWKRWAREWASANMRNDKSEAQRIINEVAAAAGEPGHSAQPSAEVAAMQRMANMIGEA